MLEKGENKTSKRCFRITHIWSVDIWCVRILWGEPPGSWWATAGRRGCLGIARACSHSWPHVLCKQMLGRWKQKMFFNRIQTDHTALCFTLDFRNVSLLACRQFDCERAAQRVHLVGSRFPGHWGVGGRGAGRAAAYSPAAVFTVDEELSNLLGYCNVVHHNR